jgi:hypothetical protein
MVTWHALLEWAEGPFFEDGENFFSSTGEEWRMKKTSCGRFYYFSHGVASFTRNPHYKKCKMDETTDVKSERMNRT